MSDTLIQAKAKIAECKVTGDIRKLSAKLFHNLEDISKEYVFTLCESLLEQRQWALGVVAYDFAHRVKKQYDSQTFDIFEGWLKEYVRGWGDCDDFCTHAFGNLLVQQPQLIERVKEWTKSSDFWVRRAAAVVLILPIKKHKCESAFAFEIADALMQDSHDLVLKGYGWMLKILAREEPEHVISYLEQNRSQMPRVSFRYAIEKLSKEQRDSLMKGIET